jgi:cellulose biosynthesis protein BcsQ
MGTIQLIIALEDQEYAELLMNYIHNSEYADKVSVMMFTRFDSFNQVLEEGVPADLSLVQPEWMSGRRRPPQWRTMAYLTEQAMEGGEALVLSKYQPLSRLMENLLAGYYELAGTKPVRESACRAETKIISVYSASGGTGKTTVALNLAKQLSIMRYRVFYLNLEGLSGLSALLGADNDDGFSQMLYFIKSRSPALDEKLRQYVREDRRIGAHRFDPPVHLDDMRLMTDEDAKLMLTTLADSGRYDIIVADLESSLHERVIACLDLSGQIIWLVVDEPQCLHRTEMLLTKLQHERGYATKTELVVNRFTGTWSGAWNSYSYKPAAILPYIPHWKQPESLANLLASSVFNRNLSQYCKRFAGSGRRGAE